jgi:acetyl esterase/lipase
VESVVALVLTANALQPIPGTPISPILFFLSWLTGELAPQSLVIQGLVTIGFVLGGALDRHAGRLALALSAAVMAGLGILIWEGMRARPVTEKALREGLGEGYLSKIPPDRSAKYDLRVPWRQLILPFRQVHPDVDRIADLQYGPHGKRNRLDVYAHKDRPTGSPILIQIHGSGWTVSQKEHQGKPIMLHLASRGWVCVAPNYRLSPRATWPDHLVDVKRVIAWVREHAHEFGGDPDFIAVTGGSAGGHLAAMLALTPNEPEYQPGFEDADTHVDACIPFYPPTHLDDRSRPTTWGQLRFLLEPVVFKTKLKDNPEVFRKASPVRLVNPEAPPFFVLHGRHDLLVPTWTARRFVEELRKVSRNPVVYAELPGGQHAFDVFPSIRTAHVVRAVERFLDYLLATRGEPVPGHGSDTPERRAGAKAS